jgi:hypothetical protein
VDEISSKVYRPGDPFSGRLSAPIRFGGTILVPLGTRVDGKVNEVRPNRGGERPAQVDLRITRLYLPDETFVELETAPLVRQAEAVAPEVVIVPRDTQLVFTLDRAVTLPLLPAR